MLLPIAASKKIILTVNFKRFLIQSRRFCKGGAKVQVTGHRSGHRSVTGHRPQARSQVRPQVTHKNNSTLDKTVLD